MKKKTHGFRGSHTGRKKPAFIFDIDGTLALRGGRDPYDWTSVEEDVLCYPVFVCLRTLRDAGFRVFLFSGRDEVCRQETEAWLRHHGICGLQLLMRPHGNREPDHDIKRRMLADIQKHWRVIAAFDDRKQVKRMWVEQGVFVFDVNQTDEEF